MKTNNSNVKNEEWSLIGCAVWPWSERCHGDLFDKNKNHTDTLNAPCITTIYDGVTSVSHTIYEEASIVLHECYASLKEHQKRKMRILNKHLLPSDTPVEGKFQLPKVLPFTGEIPDLFIPYDAKVSWDSKLNGIYCHIDDYRFYPTWTRPIPALRKVQRYKVAVAPDNSLWVDGKLCENLEQLRRSRTIQRFWQNNGVQTIQAASWGDAESVNTYAFDGLAEDSWTAIGHQRIGTPSEQKLFRYALSALIEKKRPRGLLIFGAPLDFDPGVPVIIKPSFISKLRDL